MLAITSAVMSCAVAIGISDNGHQTVNQQPRVSSPQHAEINIQDAQHDGDDGEKEPPAWRQGAVLLLCWGVFVMFTLLLSHYHRCSPAYWSIFAVQAATCIGAEALFIRLVGLPLLWLLTVCSGCSNFHGEVLPASREISLMMLEHAFVCHCLRIE